MTRSRWRIVLERRGDALEDAPALDEDVAVGVDEHVADARVAQQRLERTETEDVVQDFGKERFALRQAERRRFFRQQLRQQRANLAFRLRALDVRERFEVQAAEQLAMNGRAQLEVLLANGS